MLKKGKEGRDKEERQWKKKDCIKRKHLGGDFAFQSLVIHSLTSSIFILVQEILIGPHYRRLCLDSKSVSQGMAYVATILPAESQAPLGRPDIGGVVQVT